MQHLVLWWAMYQNPHSDVCREQATIQPDGAVARRWYDGCIPVPTIVATEGDLRPDPAEFGAWRQSPWLWAVAGIGTLRKTDGTGIMGLHLDSYRGAALPAVGAAREHLAFYGTRG